MFQEIMEIQILEQPDPATLNFWLPRCTETCSYTLYMYVYMYCNMYIASWIGIVKEILLPVLNCRDNLIFHNNIICHSICGLPNIPTGRYLSSYGFPWYKINISTCRLCLLEYEWYIKDITVCIKSVYVCRQYCYTQ